MRYRIDDSTAVLEVAGELDHHTLRDISLSVTHIIETYLPKTLILDMSGVRFMDSSGLALVIGGEGEGLSALVEKNCDYLVSIPMEGSIGSLNASVAAAILMFEKRRQDGK